MNVLETLNQSAFLALNASPGTPEAILALARFSASGIIFVVPAILLWLWFSGGRQGHRQALLQRWPDCAADIVVLQVPDPFGGDRAAYRACRDRLLRAVEEIVGRV